MRIVDQALGGLRGVARRAGGRWGVAWGPARLVLRPGPALGEARARQAVIDAVAWLGPVPVDIDAPSVGPALAGLVRFVHRLDCPVRLLTDGTGLGPSEALALVDAGLGAVRLRVAGVSDAVQVPVLGVPVADSSSALQALSAARADRAQPLDIEVLVPWQGEVGRELRALAGWCREAGADGLRLGAPDAPDAVCRDTEALALARGEPRPFSRTEAAVFDDLAEMAVRGGGPGPGLPRDGGHCPVAAQRLVVDGQGVGGVYACPFHAGAAPAGTDPSAAWAGGEAHRAAISGCTRRCAAEGLRAEGVLPVRALAPRVRRAIAARL
jgi:hypothetical protein